jgi:hypothetical protein
MRNIPAPSLFEVFSEAFAALDIDVVNELLHEDGEFYSVDSDDSMNKQEFVKWLKNEFSIRMNHEGFTPLKCTIDRCIGCEFNCKVVLFDDGFFPVRRPKIGQKLKAGFLPLFKKGKIMELKVCATFLETENRYSRPSDFDDEIPF